MTKFTVLSMKADSTVGWMVRAKAAGLRVGSSPGRFGDEVHLIKDGGGTWVKLLQSSHRALALDACLFCDGQLSILMSLQACGLVERTESERDACNNDDATCYYRALYRARQLVDCFGNLVRTPSPQFSVAVNFYLQCH